MHEPTNPNLLLLLWMLPEIAAVIGLVLYYLAMRLKARQQRRENVARLVRMRQEFEAALKATEQARDELHSRPRLPDPRRPGDN